MIIPRSQQVLEASPDPVFIRMASTLSRPVKDETTKKTEKLDRPKRERRNAATFVTSGFRAFGA